MTFRSSSIDVGAAIHETFFAMRPAEPRAGAFPVHRNIAIGFQQHNG